MTITAHGNQSITCPEGVAVLDLDPYDPEILTAPEPLYQALHAVGGLAYLPKYAALICGRYDITREIFSDHERFVSSRGVGLSDFSLAEPWRPPSIILEVDPPDHARTRRALMRALSPKVVREVSDQFEADASALIDSLLAQPEIDAVAAIAEAFPTRVFPRALGLKEADPRKLLEYGAMVFNTIGPDNAVRQASMKTAAEVVPWITASCARDKMDSRGFGAALYAMADAGEITEDEAGMLVRSLLSAGVDTTVTGIGNALWALSQNPAEYAKLVADPTGMALPAFEETLRFTSPVQAFFRTASMDCTVGGVAVPEGSKILCVLGAANRDPDHWDAPHRFDISRKTAGHLALGVGAHVCVGQNIARAEGRAVLRALAERVTRLEPTGPAVWRPNNAIHALAHLPLRLVTGPRP